MIDKENINNIMIPTISTEWDNSTIIKEYTQESSLYSIKMEDLEAKYRYFGIGSQSLKQTEQNTDKGENDTNIDFQEINIKL